MDFMNITLQRGDTEPEPEPESLQSADFTQSFTKRLLDYQLHSLTLLSTKTLRADRRKQLVLIGPRPEAAV